MTFTIERVPEPSLLDAAPLPEGGSWRDRADGIVRRSSFSAEPFLAPTDLSDLTAHLNDPQAAAVLHGTGPLLVAAGPGSGKTRVLTHRVAALLRQGVPPGRVLAVTFTNKAANEMRTRLETLIGSDVASKLWVGTFHSVCVRILRRNAAAARLSPDFTILDADDAKRLVGVIMREMVREGEDLPKAQEVTEVASLISWAKNNLWTVDQLALHRHAKAPRAAEVMVQYDRRKADLEAVDYDDLLVHTVVLLRQNPDLAKRYADRLAFVLVDEFQDTNAPQYEIISRLTASWHNLTVVGDLDQCHPAGTRVATTSGAVAIEDLDPEQHRLISWNPATEKLRATAHPDQPGAGRRFKVAAHPFEGNLHQVTAGTESVTATGDHRFLVRWNRSATNKHAVTLLRRGSHWRLTSSFLARELSEEIPLLLGPVARATADGAEEAWVLSVHNTEEDARIEVEVLAANSGLPTVVFPPLDGSTPAGGLSPAALIEVYARVDDQGDKALVLLADHGRRRDCPFWSRAAQRPVAERTHHVAAANLVAGVVDLPIATDREVRWETVTRITKVPYDGTVHSIEVDDDHNYIAEGVIVGNCVYSFRAAQPHLLEGFEKHHPDATVIRLDQNYRSTKAIVEAASAIVAPNPSSYRPRLWTDNDNGIPVRVHELADNEDEADFVARHIQAGIRSGRSPIDFAVLYRMNAMSLGFERALSRVGIPVRIVGGQRFYDYAEIRDVLAYLRLVVRDDPLAVRRVCSVPRRGLGESTVDKAIAHALATGEPLLDGIRTQLGDGTAGRSTKGWADLIESIDAITNVAATRGTPAAIDAICDLPGFLEVVLARGGNQSEDRRDRLHEMVSDATRHVADGLWTPAGVDVEDHDEVSAVRVSSLDGLTQVQAYLDHVSLLTDLDEGTEANAVALMTGHASKGKEFPVVFCVGWEEGLFPHERSRTAAEVAEERRLAFVSASRAEQELTITHVRERMMWGKWSPQEPSRFLDDLPDSVEFTYASQLPIAAGNVRHASPAYGSASNRPTQWTPPRPAPKPASATSAGAAPSVPPPRVSVDELSVGVRVRHTTHGLATVTAVDAASNQISVRFDDGSKRTLLLQHAPLVLL